ncbi:MAG: hypothetical protein K6F60_03075 [Eubacterium sp.]|nr:hypothetical protein [Eubacterium sp.]
MMISPQGYIDEVKDYPYDKLIEERNKLINSIMSFEKSYFAGDRSGDAWNNCPSPDVVYQCELEYLSELCAFMQERFNKEYI